MSKFGNVKCEYDGRSFPSKGERACYEMLKLLESAGQVSDIECQLQVYLSAANILYKPDFKFYDLVKFRHVHAEFKGFETEVWRLKRRLWAAYGPTPLLIYRMIGGRVTLTEEIPGVS